MNSTVKVGYARKPSCINDVKESSFGLDPLETTVVETKAMSTEEYDAFAQDFYASRDWLDGKGGSRNGVMQAIEITAPEREPLYVNPEGHSYARYVGIRVDNIDAAPTTKYPHVHVQLTGKDGNAFFILGRCQGAARKAGIPADQIKAFMDEASAGNYDHLLATCMRWFDCH
jgi:hypothetical protein